MLVSWRFYLILVGMSCTPFAATYLGTLRKVSWVQVKVWRGHSGPDIAGSLADVSPARIGNLVGSESGSKMAKALKTEKKAWELFKIWQATPKFGSALPSVSSLSPILARQGQLVVFQAKLAL